MGHSLPVSILREDACQGDDVCIFVIACVCSLCVILYSPDEATMRLVTTLWTQETFGETAGAPV